MTSGEPLTKLLQDWRDGDEQALELLTPAVYAELKRLAVSAFRGERVGHTLQPTALVNEAYMNQVNAKVDWQDRAHFFAIAARMMRRILVNHARGKQAAKRGSGNIAVTFNDKLYDSPDSQDQITVLVLDELLAKLAKLDKRCAQVVELHYFGGLTHKEMSSALDISTSTLERDLKFAKAWMHKNMSADGATPTP